MSFIQTLNKRKKAQAAITDALFFLLIIVSLCVLMFSYSATYGDRIVEATNDLYFKEFTNSSMKTIFTTTVPLSFDLNYQTTKEVDYLITGLKDDFYTDGKIGSSDINKLSINNSGDIIKFNLYSMIKTIIKPIDTYDYLFYLYNTTNGEFEFFMLKQTIFEETSYTPQAPLLHKKSYDINSTRYYLCKPSNNSSIINIFSKINNIYSSSVPLKFTDKSSGNTETKDIQTTFAIWPASIDLNTTTDIPELNCNQIEEIVYTS